MYPSSSHIDTTLRKQNISKCHSNIATEYFKVLHFVCYIMTLSLIEVLWTTTLLMKVLMYIMHSGFAIVVFVFHFLHLKMAYVNAMQDIKL